MKIFITIIMLFPLLCYGQKQGNIWYFGGSYPSGFNLPGAGIDFNTDPPIALTNSGMNFTEGSSAYCNSAGELLFYAQGDTVYDRTHKVMYNGGGLGGHWSTQQSVLIVPVTGDTNKYYIFNNDGSWTSNGTGLYYSIIDMKGNAGLGAVLKPKATHLIGGTSEQLTGCKHSNGTDFWVIAADSDSSILNAFQVTPSGVLPPIISNLGFSTLGINSFASIGSIEINPNGDRIAIKYWVSQQKQRQLIDFNQATGVFSNPVSIGNMNDYNSACGFSPDGNLFYDWERTVVTDSLFQYNLNATNIDSSRLFIFRRHSRSIYDSKIGPDGKLYFSGDMGYTYLDAINFPNILGLGCNFQENAISLAGISSGSILPNELLIANYNNNTGIKDYESADKISVYPNPTNSEFIIKTNQTSFSADDRIQLYSIIGKQLYSSKINSQQTTVNLSKFPQGTYIITTTINGKQKTFKILKE